MQRGAARPGAGDLGWLRSLIFATILGTLLFVVTRELREGHMPLAGPPVVADCSDRLAELTVQIEAVTSRLAEVGLPLPVPVEERQGAGALRWVLRNYQVEASPSLGLEGLEQKFAVVSGGDPCVSVVVTPEDAGSQVQIGVDGLLTHTIVVRWSTDAGRRSRIALVIWDLGNDLLAARRITEINAPVAFAVRPLRPFSREVAELANLFNREVLLHLSAAAESEQDIGEPLLLAATMSEVDAQGWLERQLTEMPHVIGVASGPDSPLMASAEQRGFLLSWLKLRQLFLVDGRVTPGGGLAEAAAPLQVRLARQTVLIDRAEGEAEVREQLAALVRTARELGSAVGIGRAHETVLDALRTAVSEWQQAEIEIVSVSTLAVVPSLAGR